MCFWFAAGAIFHQLPHGFLPDEDQGAVFIAIRLPDGASVPRADAATRKIENIVSRIPGVAGTLTLGGLDIATRTNNSNVATIIARLTPWDERHAKNLQLASILAAMQKEFSQVPEAFTFAFGLPPILGLSATGGFQYMLEDRLGGDVHCARRDRRPRGRRRAGAAPSWEPSSAPSAPTFRNTKWTWIWPRSRRSAFPSPTPITPCRRFSAAFT